MLQYSSRVRAYKKKMGNIKDAVNRTVDECIQEGRLVEFLEKHRGEIMANVLTDFNEEAFIKDMKEEGREEAKFEIVINLLDILSDEEISMRIGLPLETVQQLRKENE